MKPPTVISKENLAFRAAVPKEKAQVLALYRIAANDGETEWDDAYPNAETVDYDLSVNGLFVLCSGEQIIGAISMVPWDDLDEMPIWSSGQATVLARLCVHPHVRGHGFGHMLVEEIRRVAKARGYTVTHHIASKYIEAPLRIYRSMGFRQVGEVHLFDTDYLAFELEL